MLGTRGLKQNLHQISIVNLDNMVWHVWITDLSRSVHQDGMEDTQTTSVINKTDSLAL